MLINNTLSKLFFGMASHYLYIIAQIYDNLSQNFKKKSSDNSNGGYFKGANETY